MIQITGDELKKIAYQRRISSWTADTCATCDYPIKYKFNGSHPEVQHDPGCNCSDQETQRQRYMPSSWEALAIYINGITDIEHEKKVKQFWGL